MLFSKCSGLSQQLWVSILSLIETVMTYVSFIGHSFLISLFRNPIESRRVGIKLSMSLIWLVPGTAWCYHATTCRPVCFSKFEFSCFWWNLELSVPHFQVFNEKNWKTKLNFVAVRSTFRNNCTISVSECKGRRTLADFLSPDKKSPLVGLVYGEFRQGCDKIGACQAISGSARSQNVLSCLVG